MNHIRSAVIDEVSDQQIRHLESCERCRKRISTDIDLGSVRDRLLLEATAEHGQVLSLRRSTTVAPWLVAGSAAVLVLALFAPMLFSGRGLDESVSPTPTSPRLPALPDSRRPDPPAPRPGSEAVSFEMKFEGSDGTAGRLIWAAPDFYEGLRSTSGADTATFNYGFYRTGSEAGFNSRTVDPFPKDDDGGPTQGAFPVDPSVPWHVLLERLTPSEMWSELGGSVDPETTEPTHPLAVSGYVDSELRVEWSEEGLPVLIEIGPAGRVFRVTQLTTRAIRAGEVGNNVELPFRYAIQLAQSTSDAQRSILFDGIVTFADYESAAVSTAECAGSETRFDTQTGLFTFDDAAGLTNCRHQLFDDIEAVWRTDSQWLSEDEFSLIHATIEGRADLVAIYEADAGPELPLASGSGWATSIWERGPGICYRTQVGNSLQGGCISPAEFPLPLILLPNVTTEISSSGELVAVEITGLVTERADLVVVTFESGDKVEAFPGETSRFGLKGFGLPFAPREFGAPVTIEALGGGETLGTYLHRLDR